MRLIGKNSQNNIQRLSWRHNMNDEMKNIRNILGGILAVCILALVLIGLFWPKDESPATETFSESNPAYHECVEMGFSPKTERFYDCIALLTTLERAKKLNEELGELLNLNGFNI